MGLMGGVWCAWNEREKQHQGDRCDVGGINNLCGWTPLRFKIKMFGSIYLGIQQKAKLHREI